MRVRFFASVYYRRDSAAKCDTQQRCVPNIDNLLFKSNIRRWMQSRRAVGKAPNVLQGRVSWSIGHSVLTQENGVLCFPSPSSVSPSCLATERSTLPPTPRPKRSWMACWSPTPPRCTCCRPGWQVMMAPPLLPSGLSVTVCCRVVDLPVYRRSVCFP